MIKPGTKVTCSLHPDWGVGCCTCVVHKGEIGFVVWGEFGKMGNRKYDIVNISTLQDATGGVYQDEQEREEV